MTKRKEIILLILGIIIIAIVILFIWAIQNKKITPFAGTIHSASLSLSPAVGTLKLNQETSIDILIDAQNLQSSDVEISLKYDSQIIQIIDQDPNFSGIQIATTSLFPIIFENIVEEEFGVIRLSVSKEKDGQPILINSPRVLASIKFIPIKKDLPIKINFDFEKGKTSDCNIFQYSSGVEQDVLMGVNNGYYEIKE